MKRYEVPKTTRTIQQDGKPRLLGRCDAIVNPHRGLCLFDGLL